ARWPVRSVRVIAIREMTAREAPPQRPPEHRHAPPRLAAERRSRGRSAPRCAPPPPDRLGRARRPAAAGRAWHQRVAGLDAAVAGGDAVGELVGAAPLPPAAGDGRTRARACAASPPWRAGAQAPDRASGAR